MYLCQCNNSHHYSVSSFIQPCHCTVNKACNASCMLYPGAKLYQNYTEYFQYTGTLLALTMSIMCYMCEEATQCNVCSKYENGCQFSVLTREFVLDLCVENLSSNQVEAHLACVPAVNSLRPIKTPSSSFTPCFYGN